MKAWMADRRIRALSDNLEKQLPGLMSKNNLPGLSVILIRDAEIAWGQAFGIQSGVSQTSVTQDTVFEAASLSKPVFAYACLKLCEENVLELDTPLADYLPDPYLPDEPRSGQITMRHVLSHTTGFPNWRPKGKPLRMCFSPGERFSYSGEGFMYLQAVLAQVTGQEPAEYMWSSFLKPFGLKNSRFVWTGQEGLPAAVGHDEKGKAAEKYLWTEMNAAASLHCTTTDFGKFMCGVMRPLPDIDAHLSVELNREMLTPQVQVNDSLPWDADWPKPEIRINDQVSWGLGWGIQRTSMGDSIWHWGDNGNYRAFAVGLPEEGHGIVMMTNGKNGQMVINHILRGIIGGDHPGLDWLDG